MKIRNGDEMTSILKIQNATNSAHDEEIPSTEYCTSELYLSYKLHAFLSI